jgi:glycosyltransferase involved in cell wall biosynthesis
MIYLALPVGNRHGWGVCGKYLTRELAAITEVALITDPFDAEDVGDELDHALLKSKVALTSPPGGAPVLQSIANTSLTPYRPDLSGKPTVGYTFFEDNLAVGRYVEHAPSRYDIVATGSRWCEQVLRHYGLTSVSTVLQGVDSSLFHPNANGKEYFKDTFVVFSGGKFEYRKGQDLVIRAFKVLQDRHPDVMLITAWHNIWQFSTETMCASPHIRFQPRAGDFRAVIQRVLADNGVRLDRVITLGLRSNLTMARIYSNTDVGLFPNRCEGGTNLVLMEYMACGKPAIASYNSGHKDILTARNSVRIEKMKPVTVRAGEDVALWDDPDLDETIEKLEWAYQNRDSLQAIGEQAATDMSRLTWRSAAEQFYKLLTGQPQSDRSPSAPPHP